MDMIWIFSEKTADIFDKLSDALFISVALVIFSKKSPFGHPLLVLVSIDTKRPDKFIK